MRSSRDRVGHDAIKPDDGKQSGKSAEYRGEAGYQSLGPQGESNLFVHGLQPNDRNMRVELPHTFSKPILDYARIGLRAQIDVHEAKFRALEIREECLRRRRLPQISVFLVRNHTDDFNVRTGWFHFVHEPEALPDRTSARKVLPGKGLIDDSGFVFDRPVVLGGDGTPGDDRNTERSKVVRADLAENRLFLDRRSFEIWIRLFCGSCQSVILSSS